VYRTIIMLSASSMCRKIYCQTSIHLCVNKRRTHNLYHSSVYLALPSGQLRCTFNSADQSRLAMPLDLPTFATDFEPSLLASPSFRKRSPTILSSVWSSYAEIIGCMWSCDRSSDLREVTRMFRSLSSSFSSSSSSSFSFSFLSRLGADTVSSSRDFLLSHARRGCQQSVAAVW